MFSEGVGKVRALAPTGMLGAGFPEESLELALRHEPTFIGCDAGSTDTGPSQLATGRAYFSRAACQRDLALMLQAARAAGIPLLVGSCGTGGGDLQVEWVREIVLEIAREHDLHFNLAVIRSEQQKSAIKNWLKTDRIRPLNPAPILNGDVIDRALHVVAMMGVEPFQAALRAGADVILAGRSSDTSIFAAIPRMQGVPPGPAWHAAKILECGAAAVTHRTASDSMIAALSDDHFVVEPPNPALSCTPQSVASHTLYENADPFLLVEPSGTLDCSGCSYEAVSERAVRVTGSTFRPAREYTVKLEAAELAGYQTLVIGGIRDPLILQQFDDWLAGADRQVRHRINRIYGTDLRDQDFRLNYRVFGRNGVMGAAEPTPYIQGHEVALIIEVTAQTQDIATALAATASHMIIHYPIPQWSGLITTLASPYAPLEIERGPVYRFSMNHVVVTEDPLSMFPIEITQV